MWPNPQFPVDLVTFTDKILNDKVHLLCSDYCWKNRVMCDKGCFTMDKVVRREVKKNYNLPMSYKSEAISKHRPLLLCFFMNILIDNLLMQFFHIPNRTMCLSKKILYQYFTLLRTASPPSCHYTAVTN